MGIRGLTTFVALCNLSEHKLKKFLSSSSQTGLSLSSLLFFFLFSSSSFLISSSSLLLSSSLVHCGSISSFQALLRVTFYPLTSISPSLLDVVAQEPLLRHTVSFIIPPLASFSFLDVVEQPQIFSASSFTLYSYSSYRF